LSGSVYSIPEAEAGSVYVDVQGDRIAVTTCCRRSVGVADVEDLWQGKSCPAATRDSGLFTSKLPLRGGAARQRSGTPTGPLALPIAVGGEFSPLLTEKQGKPQAIRGPRIVPR